MFGNDDLENRVRSSPQFFCHAHCGSIIAFVHSKKRSTNSCWNIEVLLNKIKRLHKLTQAIKGKGRGAYRHNNLITSRQRIYCQNAQRRRRSCKRFRGYTQKRGGICLRICINQQNPFTLCCKRRRQMHCRCGFPCSSFLVCNCNNFGHIDSVSCVKTLAIKKESDRVTEVTLNAGVAELADAQDSKSCDRKVVWVR